MERWTIRELTKRDIKGICEKEWGMEFYFIKGKEEKFCLLACFKWKIRDKLMDTESAGMFVGSRHWEKGYTLLELSLK